MHHRIGELQLDFFDLVEYSGTLSLLSEISCIRQVQVQGNVPQSVSSALEEAFKINSFQVARIRKMKLCEVSPRVRQSTS